MNFGYEYVLMNIFLVNIFLYILLLRRILSEGNIDSVGRFDFFSKRIVVHAHQRSCPKIVQNEIVLTSQFQKLIFHQVHSTVHSTVHLALLSVLLLSCT